jgi:DNA-binding CsgD family transcriptional regulator
MQSSEVRKLPHIQDKVQRTLAAARIRLPEQTFEAARAAGAVLSLAEAVEAGLAFLADVQLMPRPSQAFGLTPREAEVLALVIEGLSDREIAAMLFISPKTVGDHVSNILAKFDVRTRAAAVAYAHKHGLA